MSNPNKRWSWGAALGRGVGPLIPSAATGALMGSFGGPLGPALGALIGGAGAFANGFFGAAFGHWWDAPPREPESFGSAALYTLVVTGVLEIVSAGLLAPLVVRATNVGLSIFLMTGVVAFVAAASRSLIDDWEARHFSSVEEATYSSRTVETARQFRASPEQT